MKLLFRRKKLSFHGSLAWLADPRWFARFLRVLHLHKWVVYAKKPFGGPEHVLHYLACYTHRVAIFNRRLIGMEDGKVAFRWKAYAHGGKERKMTLTGEEFIRRFLLHVLPKGLVRLRHYGWMANRCRRERAALCRALLGTEPEDPESAQDQNTRVRRCPNCGGLVEVVEINLPPELARRQNQPTTCAGHLKTELFSWLAARAGEPGCSRSV